MSDPEKNTKKSTDINSKIFEAFLAFQSIEQSKKTLMCHLLTIY